MKKKKWTDMTLAERAATYVAQDKVFFATWESTVVKVKDA